MLERARCVAIRWSLELPADGKFRMLDKPTRRRGPARPRRAGPGGKGRGGDYRNRRGSRCIQQQAIDIGGMSGGSILVTGWRRLYVRRVRRHTGLAEVDIAVAVQF
jgi:hypothetical protein